MTRAAASHRPPVGLLVAAAAGLAHATVSAYWAAGGDWLLDTLGTAVVERFADVLWLLWVVAAVKVAGALGPLALHRLGWPLRVLTRGACWAGAAVLVLWGGLNTVVGAAVLGGLIRPDGGYDRPGMVGHAFLWDPLFLLWGVGLTAGLWASGRTRS